MPAPGPEVKEIVNRFSRALKSRGIHPQRIILYGSHAKNTAGKESDIDLVVISEDFAGLSLERRYELLGEAIADVMEPIEPLAYTPEEFEGLPSLSVIAAVMRDPSEHIEVGF